MIYHTTVSTKKGHSQDLRFLVRQVIPFPSIVADGTGARWRNNGCGIFPEYGNSASGLRKEYQAELLRSDWTDEEILAAPDSRLLHAGYDGNPGAVILRGRDLGEMSVNVDTINLGMPCCWFRVRGFKSPSPGEKD